MPYEVVPPSTREHLSFSQLQTAAQCGEAYRLQYVEGSERGPLNVPALCGSAFHSAVEEWELGFEGLASHYSGEEVLTFDLTRIVKDHIRAILDTTGTNSEDLIYYGKQDLPYWFRNKIPVMAKAYVKRRIEEVRELDFRWGLPDYHAGAASMSMEVACELEVASHPFVAYIDQVFFDSQKRLVIRDIKTGKPKPGHAMQLEQYRLAFKKSHGIDAAYGQLLYLHREEAYVQVVKWSLSDTDVERLTGRLVHTLHDGVFLVNGPFNGFCDVCDFRAGCAYGKVGVHGSS